MESPLKPHTQGYAGGFHRVQCGFCGGQRLREWLLNEHVLAGSRRSNDLLGVLRIGRRQDHCIDLWRSQHIIKALEQAETVLGCKSRTSLERPRCARLEPDRLASLLNRADEYSPPPPETYDRRTYHGISSTAIVALR